MTKDNSRERHVRGALALRSAVLGLLAGAGLSAREEDALRNASREAWRIVLLADACAMPVAARLRACGQLDQLDGAVRQEIAEHEMREVQRVLAARTTLRTLDAAGNGLGIRMILLKGGVPVAEPSRRAVDLGDVDLLLEPADASRLWTALRDGGWTMTSGDVPGAGVRTQHHLAELFPPGAGLSVEIHDALERSPASAFVTSPLAGFAAIERLAGVDAVLTVLRHSAIQHPFRRGHVRDLVVLADLLEAEGDDVYAAALRAMRGDVHEPELRDVLDMARAMQTGQRVVESPRVRAFIARKYAGVTRRIRSPLFAQLGWWNMGYLALERPVVARARLRAMLAAAFRPVPADSLLPPSLPARVARGAYQVVLVAGIAVAAPLVRRHARRLTSS